MEQRVNIEQADQFVTSARSKADQLRQRTGELPPVNKDGSSECDFAEEWYAEHEELRSEVQGLLAQGHEYLTVVEEEITKLGHDLAVISAHEGHLHRDAPRAHFTEAEAAVAALYNRYRQLKNQIIETLTYIDQVLQEASAKRFPGRIPRKGPGLPGAAPVQGKPAEPTGRVDAGRELDALLKMDHRDHEGR